MHALLNQVTVILCNVQIGKHQKVLQAAHADFERMNKYEQLSRSLAGCGITKNDSCQCHRPLQ